MSFFRKLVCLFLLGHVGCGENPDYTSRHGVRIFYQDENNWWEPYQVDAQESFLLDQLKQANLHPHAEEAISFVTAYVFPDKIRCNGSTGYCNGLQDYTNIYVRNMGCPYNTAYAHELAHWIQQMAGIYDYNHTEKALWEIADSAPAECN